MDWDILLKKQLIASMFSKRWSLTEQAAFFSQLGELSEEGFSLREVITFFPVLFQKREQSLQRMVQSLEKGIPFEECVREIGVNETIQSQVYLAMNNGRFAKACLSIGAHLKRQAMERQKLHQLLVYPCLLVVFLVIMVMTMRSLLLEQLIAMVNVDQLQREWYLYLVWKGFVHLPMIVVGGVCLVLILSVCCWLYWHHKSPLQKVQWGSHVPLVGKLVRQYYTYVYAQEFSYFLGSGQSLLTMVQLMEKGGTSRLTKAIARHIDVQMREGDSFAQAVLSLRLFQPALVWLIVEGELTHQLDVKLQTFSEYTFQQYHTAVERKLLLIQPIFFIGIGLVIVALYLILLLPTMTMIGGN